MKQSEKPVAEVSTSEPAVTSVTEEAIRERAYEPYEQRARLDRHALDDWLTAEAERQLKRKSAAA